MSHSVGLVVTSLLIPLAFQTLLTLALQAWGNWVSHRQGEGIWWMRAARGPVVAFALTVIGIVGSSIGLLLTYWSATSSPPEQRATVLVEGFTLSMNASALTAILSLLLNASSVVLFIVGTVRRSSPMRSTGDCET
ncbi:hypothetical protein [Archangium lansingense]|uniref:Uncharacterized protein n=1 Tax=Archangium lansingense TaxID=2995310 RepID=A0ABT4AQ30_9BACT|nr:hypothetical protein [Archangium lansinium]MCY1083789.1 hypothetical protein [Archangium lansinium]